jgi:hypothetical protein
VRNDTGSIGRKGGGVAIGVDRNLTLRDLSNTIPEALRSLEIVLVQFVHQIFELYALCVYLNNYNNLRGYLKPPHQWLIELISCKPEAIFIIGGDLNCAHQPIKHLYELSRDEKTYHRTVLGTPRLSLTDWLLSSHALEYETVHHWTEHSDHCAILSSIEVPFSPPKGVHLILPRADVAYDLCAMAALTAVNWQDFTEMIAQ